MDEIKRGYPTEATNKSKPTGGDVPTIDGSMHVTTGFETEKRTESRRQEGGPVPGGISGRSYTTEPDKGASRGRRIRDGVKGGGEIIKKGG